MSEDLFPLEGESKSGIASIAKVIKASASFLIEGKNGWGSISIVRVKVSQDGNIISTP